MSFINNHTFHSCLCIVSFIFNHSFVSIPQSMPKHWSPSQTMAADEDLIPHLVAVTQRWNCCDNCDIKNLLTYCIIQQVWISVQSKCEWHHKTVDVDTFGWLTELPTALLILLQQWNRHLWQWLQPTSVTCPAVNHDPQWNVQHSITK